MYLSRIAIDTKKHEAMKALFNLEKLHGMVEASFSGERHRNLWRLDQMAGEDYLLLLSHVPPQTNTLPEQIGYAGSNWETKAYDTLLSRISKGTRWNFRLTANPTTAEKNEDSKRGTVKAVTITAKQREWLKRQSTEKGFLLQDSQFDVTKSEWKTAKKKNAEIKFLAVTFEGVLEVTDPDIFCSTLLSGIGREKAYGMGLLTVVPYD